MVAIESVEDLNTWLSKELSPICDADPHALAKYVLALLRKPEKTDEELKEICMNQLDVFLQSHTLNFVEKLFASIATKSYLPAPEVAIPSEPEPVSVEKEKKREERPKEDRDRGRDRKDDRRKEKPSSDREREREKERPKESSSNQDVSSTTTAVSSSGPSSDHSSSTAKEHTANNSGKAPSPSRTRRGPLSGANNAPLGRRADESATGGPSSSAPVQDRTAGRRGGSPIRAPRRRISPPVVENKPRRRSRSPLRSRRLGGRRSPVERAIHRKERRSRSRSRSPLEKRRERDEDGNRRKKRCRDYDEQGFCVRGDACPYDHGPDPVVVDDSALAKMVGGKSVPAVPPPSFNIPPPGYNPVAANPPPPGVDAVGYNPEAPGLTMGDFSVPPPPLPSQMVAGGGPPGHWRGNPYGGVVVAPGVGYEPSGGVPVDPHTGGPVMGGMMGGMMRGRGRGRGRGSFHPYGRGGSMMGANGDSGDKVGKLPLNVATRTLIVKKIPAELNNITKLNEHFGKFGTVVNMQVHFTGAPDTALITFAARFEAIQAYKSEEPIFNNRFIRVFWYTNVMGEDAVDSGLTTKTTTLSSGVTVETPLDEQDMSPPKPKQPIVLPGPGQTSYKNPQMMEAKKAAKAQAIADKAEKEQQLRLTDLHRRSIALVTKLHDSQKIVIAKMMKEQDPEEKKTLNKMYKELEKRLAVERKNMDSLSEKILRREQRAAGGVKREDEDDSSPSPPPEGVNIKDEGEEDEDPLLDEAHLE